MPSQISMDNITIIKSLTDNTETLFKGEFTDPDTNEQRACIVKEVRLEMYKPPYYDELDSIIEKHESLSSDRLVEVYGYAFEDGVPFIVMEPADKDDLQTLIQTGPASALSPGEKLRVLLDVLDGLRDLHDAGLFHGSLNASHVLRFSDGRSKLTSFGMSFIKAGSLPWLTENAILPKHGSALAAGYDLFSAYAYSIPPQSKGLVKTDLALSIPEDCYGRIAPRSGLALKHHIDVGAGVIDADYRGNVGVVLFNHSDKAFEVTKGDRIAQLILEKIARLDIEEVSSLEDTDRGAGGFGSTGVGMAKKD